MKGIKEEQLTGQDKIDGSKKINEQNVLEGVAPLDLRTSMLYKMIQENDIKKNLYADIYKKVDAIKLKLNMSVDACEDMDYIVGRIILTTLNAVTKLQNVLIVI